MSTTCCTQTKPNDDPCAARPLPGGDFCLFHDPAHAAAQAEARRKGGSTPRRRCRRYPRLLNHLHVAELLGELFIDALNDSETIDTQRLRALTHLAQVLLKVVGVPKDSPLTPEDRREPTATEDHLLRVYPLDLTDLEPALSVDPTAAEPAPEPLNARTPEPQNSRTPNTQPPTPTSEPLHPEQDTNTLGSAICLRYRWGCHRATPPPVLLAERASVQFLVAPRHCYARTIRGIPEPRANRTSTGAPATNTDPYFRPASSYPCSAGAAPIPPPILGSSAEPHASLAAAALHPPLNGLPPPHPASPS